MTHGTEVAFGALLRKRRSAAALTQEALGGIGQTRAAGAAKSVGSIERVLERFAPGERAALAALLSIAQRQRRTINTRAFSDPSTARSSA